MTRPQRAHAPSLTLDELLAQSAWFTALDAAAQAQVRRDASERVVALGDSLSHHGERQHAWFGVLEGLIKWAITAPDGRTVTLGGQSVGSWFGEGTVLRGVARTADVIALRDSRVALMPAEVFEWLRGSERSFEAFLLRQINERMHWFLGNFAAHHLLDTDSQVARALVGLFHSWLHPGSDPRLRVSQEEIANLSGLSRQRCNAALRRLAAAGLIEIEYGGITVVDLPRLRTRVLAAASF